MNNIILYLDDNLDGKISRDLATIINDKTDLGWEFHSEQISDYEELLKTIEEVKPAIILLDNKLEFETGIQGDKAIYYIKEYYNGALTILISTHELAESFFYTTSTKENIDINFIDKLIEEYEKKQNVIKSIAFNAGKYKISHESIADLNESFHATLNNEIDLNDINSKRDIVNFLENVKKIVSSIDE